MAVASSLKMYIINSILTGHPIIHFMCAYKAGARIIGCIKIVWKFSTLCEEKENERYTGEVGWCTQVSCADDHFLERENISKNIPIVLNVWYLHIASLILVEAIGYYCYNKQNSDETSLWLKTELIFR
jgi:hypothetical protein